MDFNDLTQKFTQKVKQLGKDTADEVQKLNKLRQLNGKISDAKKQIENVYSEIGKKFYELHKDYIPEGFEEMIKTINDKTAEIGQLKEQVREVKGVVLCASCNMEVSADERFCPNCGSKMPEVVEIADEEDEAAVVMDAADVTEDVKETAADAVEGAKEAAADAVEEAKEAAADVAGDVKEAAADAAEAAADAVEEAKEAAADVAGDVKEAAADVVEKAKEKAEEIVRGAKEIAGNAADELKDAAEKLF